MGIIRHVAGLIKEEVTHLNVGAAKEDTIQLPYTNQEYYIVGYRYTRTGGSAVTYRPRIGATAAWTDDDIDEAWTSRNVPVTTRINKDFGRGRPIVSDANGRVYHRPGFDAGADNDGNAVIWFLLAERSDVELT